MKRKILIAIDEFAKNSSDCLDMINGRDLEIIWHKSGESLDFNKYKHLYEDVDYIIAGLEKYNSEFFKINKNVKAISRVGVGVDNIDLLAAQGSSTKIFITTDKPSVAVAELCVSNMIALLRGTFLMNKELKNGNWEVIQGRDIRNCTVGIIGVGSIGKQVARRLTNFEPKIIGYARTWDNEFANKYDIKRYQAIEDIIKMSDILTVHLPLEDSTRGLIDAKLIKLMKKDAVILNTSRAGVFDNNALADSLRKNHLLGAAIDVFDEDRNIAPYDEIENVILTPHVGSHTSGTRIAMEESAMSNILAYDSLLNPRANEDITYLLSVVETNSVI